MVYLSHEIAVLQAKSQSFDATIAQLNSAAAQQDRAAVAASARATAARAEAVRVNGVAATFQAQATADDAKAANLDQQIAQQLQDEPPKMIEVGDGKFRPNPEWNKWKAALDALTRQRDQARADAATARASANQNSAAAAQSQAAAAAADQDAATAKANAAQLRQQAGAVGTQKDGVTQQIASFTRWQQEISRQPLSRTALETVAHEVAAYADNLESQYAVAVDLAATAEKQQWYLQTLVQELSSKINGLNAQLPAAAAEVASAAANLSDIETRIIHVMKRVPE